VPFTITTTPFPRERERERGREGGKKPVESKLTGMTIILYVQMSLARLADCWPGVTFRTYTRQLRKVTC
jgi:hypothetical protein